ncbi:MAG TPA: hypothetical protein VFL47_02850, partial [Flavisolibacter sp.]|nr:hypothetical protein [Flavisolibacter sp.]
QNTANVVFYNLQESHDGLAEKINARECITRVYGSSKRESYDYYEELVNRKVNFVAFYNYKVPQEKEQQPAKRKSNP